MKLDKKKKVEDELLDEIPESGMLMDGEEEDSEFDDFNFGGDDEDSDGDSDTSDIADDDLDDLDEDAEEQDDEEDISDDEPEEIDEPEIKVQKKNQLSPADIKVINLKKENAKLAKEKADLERKINERQTESEKATLKEKYQEQGYDEDTAEVYAKNDIRMKQLEEKQQLYEFREENEEIFKAYPQAKADIATIMRNSKLTGMTAEQICKGMYGGISDRETRALDAVKGKASKDTSKEDRANKAIGNSQADTSTGLSAKQAQYKKYLETKFNDGQKMTVAEFRKYMD